MHLSVEITHAGHVYRCFRADPPPGSPTGLRITKDGHRIGAANWRAIPGSPPMLHDFPYELSLGRQEVLKALDAEITQLLGSMSLAEFLAK